MNKSGLKSIKTETHNFARTVKKDVRIIDENAVLKSLENTDRYDMFVQPKLDTVSYKGYAKQVMNETGEILDGTEPYETEYMSIKTI